MTSPYHTDSRVLTRGGTAGDVSVRYQSTEANRLVALFMGYISHADPVARVGRSRIIHGGTNVGYLHFVSGMVQNAHMTYPTQQNSNTSWAPSGFPLLVPALANNYLEATVEALGANQAATFRLTVFPEHGGGITVTEVLS